MLQIWFDIMSGKLATWIYLLCFCFIVQYKFFPVFLGMKMYDNEYDTKENKIIQG